MDGDPDPPREPFRGKYSAPNKGSAGIPGGMRSGVNRNALNQRTSTPNGSGAVQVATQVVTTSPRDPPGLPPPGVEMGAGDYPNFNGSRGRGASYKTARGRGRGNYGYTPRYTARGRGAYPPNTTNYNSKYKHDAWQDMPSEEEEVDRFPRYGRGRFENGEARGSARGFGRRGRGGYPSVNARNNSDWVREDREPRVDHRGRFKQNYERYPENGEARGFGRRGGFNDRGRNDYQGRVDRDQGHGHGQGYVRGGLGPPPGLPESWGRGPNSNRYSNQPVQYYQGQMAPVRGRGAFHSLDRGSGRILTQVRGRGRGSYQGLVEPRMENAASRQDSSLASVTGPIRRLTFESRPSLGPPPGLEHPEYSLGHCPRQYVPVVNTVSEQSRLAMPEPRVFVNQSAGLSFEVNLKDSGISEEAGQPFVYLGFYQHPRLREAFYNLNSTYQMTFLAPKQGFPADPKTPKFTQPSPNCHIFCRTCDQYVSRRYLCAHRTVACRKTVLGQTGAFEHSVVFLLIERRIKIVKYLNYQDLLASEKKAAETRVCTKPLGPGDRICQHCNRHLVWKSTFAAAHDLLGCVVPRLDCPLDDTAVMTLTLKDLMELGLLVDLTQEELAARKKREGGNRGGRGDKPTGEESTRGWKGGRANSKQGGREARGSSKDKEPTGEDTRGGKGGQVSSRHGGREAGCSKDKEPIGEDPTRGGRGGQVNSRHGGREARASSKDKETIGENVTPERGRRAGSKRGGREARVSSKDKKAKSKATKPTDGNMLDSLEDYPVIDSKSSVDMGEKDSEDNLGYAGRKKSFAEAVTGKGRERLVMGGDLSPSPSDGSCDTSNSPLEMKSQGSWLILSRKKRPRAREDTPRLRG